MYCANFAAPPGWHACWHAHVRAAFRASGAAGRCSTSISSAHAATPPASGAQTASWRVAAYACAVTLHHDGRDSVAQAACTSRSAWHASTLRHALSYGGGHDQGCSIATQVAAARQRKRAQQASQQQRARADAAQPVVGANLATRARSTRAVSSSAPISICRKLSGASCRSVGQEVGWRGREAHTHSHRCVRRQRGRQRDAMRCKKTTQQHARARKAQKRNSGRRAGIASAR